MLRRKNRSDHHYRNTLLAVAITLSIIILNLSWTRVTAEDAFSTASPWAVKELLEAEAASLIPEEFHEDFGANITRAEFCKLALSLYYTIGPGFIDVQDNPFHDTNELDIIYAYSLGIVNGVGDGLFAPEDSISREQVSVMLYRTILASGFKFFNPDGYAFQNDYSDITLISSWALDPLTKINSLGIYQGTGTTLDPKGSLTREQAVLLILRTYKLEDLLAEQSVYQLDPKLLVAENDLLVYDTDLMSYAAGQGLRLPFKPAMAPSYQALASDVVKVTADNTLSSDERYSSIEYKGISGLKASYTESKCMWNTLFDDYYYTLDDNDITTIVKGHNIYEKTIDDEYSTYEVYYKSSVGTLYQVSTLTLGDFTDQLDDPDISRTGITLNVKSLEEIDNAEITPVQIPLGELPLDCYVVIQDDSPYLYLEMLNGEILVQRFIDIRTGMIAKEYQFSKEGAFSMSKIMTSQTPMEVNDSVFNHPTDLNYTDFTLFMYGFSFPENVEAISKAFETTFNKDTPSSIVLDNNYGSQLTIQYEGFEDDFVNPLFLSKSSDINGDPVTLINYYQDGRYVTLCPEKEMVLKYASSANEKKLFNFTTTSFVDYRLDGQLAHYIFKNEGLPSVSGLLKMYDYVIDTSDNTIKEIRVYFKESYFSEEIIGDPTIYTISSFGDFDESLYTYPDNYQVYDYGENSHNDGENAPPWYTE